MWSVERWKRSAWLALTLVPFGVLAWGALVYAGRRARERRWVTWGVAYLVLMVSGWIVFQWNEDIDAVTSDVGILMIIVSWVAPFVHGLAIRNEYLRRTEIFDRGAYERAEGRLLERDEARRLAREEPRRARELGIGRPDLPAAFSGGLVDVNNAPVDVLEELPGVGRALAERIVAVREEVDGFSSLDDMGHVLDLPAPLIDRIRADAVVLPRGVEPRRD
jgi:hypothetical protein